MATYSDFEQRQMDAASGAKRDRELDALMRRTGGCKDKGAPVDQMGGCLMCSADAGVACRHPARAAIARATGEAA
jgi:hypothetical protein